MRQRVLLLLFSLGPQFAPFHWKPWGSIFKPLKSLYTVVLRFAPTLDFGVTMIKLDSSEQDRTKIRQLRAERPYPRFIAWSAADAHV